MADYSLSETQNIQPYRVLSLQPTLENVEAGKRFIIGTNPPNYLYLDEEVPAGKVWKVTFQVSVIEEDA